MLMLLRYINFGARMRRHRPLPFLGSACAASLPALPNTLYLRFSFVFLNIFYLK